MSDLIAFERLLKHVRLEAMDRLIEEGGQTIGWEKTPAFSDLIRDADAKLERLRLSSKGVEGWRETAFGPALNAARKAKRLSLQGLADLTGLTKAHLWEMEQGRSANPCVSTIVAIGRALDVDPDELFHCLAAPVSPSRLMDFGASQVRHQPSAATSPEGSDPTQVKP